MIITSYQKYMLSICLGLLASLINIKLISKSFTHKLTKEEKDLFNKHLLKDDLIYDNIGNIYRFVPVKVNKEDICRLVKQSIMNIDDKKLTDLSVKKSEKKRILNDVFNKIKYTGKIEKNIIEILNNILDNLGIKIVPKDKLKREEENKEEKDKLKREEENKEEKDKLKREEEENKNRINIPNTNKFLLLDNRWSNKYFDDMKLRSEEDEYSRSIWGDIHKNEDDSYKKDIFHDTKLFFNINTVEDITEFGILVYSLIYIINKPKEILKYFDMTNIKDKKTRFVTLLTNKNTLNYRYFNNLEENLSNYLINLKKFKDEKITVGGRELLLIKHVYLCLRISIIDI